MKLEPFIDSLKSVRPGIVVFAGDEPFFKEEGLEAYVEALREDGPLSENTFEIKPGEKANAAGDRLIRDLATPMLFGGPVLIVVREGQDVLKAAAPVLAEVLGGKRMLPGRVVFFANSVDGRSKFAKLLKESGGFVECKKLFATAAPWQRGGSEETELSKWTLSRARRSGLKITRDAAGFLASHTGNDLLRISGEIDKMVMGLDKGGNVDLADVEEITGTSAVHTPFELWDKIESRDSAGALETLSVILKNGMRSQGGRLETDATAIANILLGMFRERIRLSARVALLVWEHQDDRSILSALRISSMFYLKKLKATGKRLNAAKVKAISEALLRAERRIKRSGHLASPVLEETVIRLVGVGL